MFLLIIFLPLASAMLIFLTGRFIGKLGTMQISIINLILVFFLNFYLLYTSILTNEYTVYTVGSWISHIGVLTVNWEFQFDLLSLVMVFVVSMISGLVHIYSWNYMANDPFIIRFFGLLSLFTFFMLVLVSSTNFIQLFLGWEGIGLCSYFLIGFWYTRIQANKSALKAIIVNRVGDIALLIAVSGIVFLSNTTDFDTIFVFLPFYATKILYIVGFEINFIEFICFWLMVAAIGKSAQIGLHTWLPDAMEGPTPVSALIHAATMVTAGIFLIIRCSFIFEYAPNTLLLICIIGSITTIFAASSGLFQNDIKKVIAYSTCSQLGYMFYSCGASNYIGSFFHLSSHAFFKALLFLSAGSVIHALTNEQDMRKMGALKNYLPITYMSFIIGSLALVGFPFLSGFYSKDFIIETSFSSIYFISNWNFILLTITAIFTMLYSLRLLYLVFWAESNSFYKVFQNIHESSWFLLIPLILLCFLSLSFGFFFKDFFIGSGNQIFSDVIYFYPKQTTLYDLENLLGLKNLPVFFNFLTVTIFLIIYSFGNTYVGYYEFYKNYLFLFLIHKWYFDYIYYTFTKSLFTASYFIWIILDKGLLEIIQPLGLTSIINTTSNFYIKYNSKLIQFYFFCSLYGIFFICILFYFLPHNF